MISVPAYNVSFTQGSAHSGIALKIEGYYRSATTQAWLQFFDTNGLPAAGAIPIKQWPIYGTSAFYFEFKRGDLTFGEGCFVGISSTEGSYTASNDKMDINVELSSPDLLAGEVNYSGDLTTAVQGINVWSEATGTANRQALVALEVDGTNLTGGGTQWIMIFATDGVNAGDTPMPSMVFPILAAHPRVGPDKLAFGVGGLQVFTIDGEPNDQGAGGGSVPGTKRYGCTVKISSTPKTFTACNGTACIKAEYRTAL